MTFPVNLSNKIKKSETIIPLYCKMGGKKVSLSISCFFFDISFRIEKPLMMWITCNFKTTETFVRNFLTIKIILKAPILTWFFCYFNARCCVTAKWNWNNPFRISHTSLTSAHSQWDLNYQNHMAASDLKKISISFFLIQATFSNPCCLHSSADSADSAQVVSLTFFFSL